MFMRFFLLFFIVTTFLSSCSVSKMYTANKKFAPEKLKEDLILLKKILEANHPSLYWYTTKDSLDNAFNNGILSITDSLTEKDFKNITAKIIAQIHCGHTSVRYSKAYSKQPFNKLPQFPVSIKTWNDSAVLLRTSRFNDSVLTRGTIITAINNIPIKRVIDSMKLFVSTDGYADIFKTQVFSFNFPVWYNNVFAVDTVHQISYLAKNGIEKTETIKSYLLEKDSIQKKANTEYQKISRRDIRKQRLENNRSYGIDSLSGAAIIRLKTFTGGRLKSFFRKTFRSLKKNNIQHLVIDVRENGGGSIMNSTRLSQYVSDKPFRIADTIVSNSRRIQYSRYIKPSFIYWLAMQITGRKKVDGKIHFKYFEKHLYKPKKNKFNGEVFILTSGYTFSASTLFINNIIQQPHVTIVGEETGGGSYGNSAIYLPNITLPNSKIRVRLPLNRLVMNKANEKSGRGIFPDISVPPNSENIRLGIDAKMEAVRNLILNKKNGSN